MANLLRKFFTLKITAYLILFPSLYFILPVYLTKIIGMHYVKFIFLFYAVNAIVIFHMLRKNSTKTYLIDSSVQDLEEKLNLLKADYSKESKFNTALKERNIRYNSLESVLEKINKSLDVDTVSDTLASEAFSLIAGGKGVCVLYLIDSQANKLMLSKTKRDDSSLFIKAKEGDIFDHWVLRHSSPLLIEDLKNDFRFDREKLALQDKRQVISLISSPLISENRFFGIIRLDNPAAHFYYQDDLRFLVYISDLGAVALENIELYKKTQDLAIHDSLTSLYTKGYFSERLKEEWKKCLRQNIPLSLFMLDIDYFKKYNDRFGHTAGDLVLKKISQIMVESLSRLNPIVSRFGGEEFCIMINNMDKNSAYSTAEILRQRIEKEKIVLRKFESSITVSIGVANFPIDASSEEELVRLSDKALYQAKQKGRNRVCSI